MYLFFSKIDYNLRYFSLASRIKTFIKSANLIETDYSIALVLLSYNEKHNLHELFPAIPLNEFQQVLAIDGGSTDGTLDIYKNNKIKYYIQSEKGRGNAFQMAEKIIKTDGVIFFSTDGNENPADLKVMKNYLLDGYDMVVAGRYLLNGSNTDNSDDPFLLRKIAGIVGSKLIALIWGSTIKDSINGFRGFKLNSLRQLKLDAPSHEIELQSTIRSAKLKLNVIEFPTIELERKYEIRKKSAGTIKLIFNLGYFLLREIFIGKRFI
jgi:glycosyltransferase involved in cell wall biosynthesis